MPKDFELEVTVTLGVDESGEPYVKIDAPCNKKKPMPDKWLSMEIAIDDWWNRMFDDFIPTGKQEQADREDAEFHKDR
jgi:hypothetical protein